MAAVAERGAGIGAQTRTPTELLQELPLAFFLGVDIPEDPSHYFLPDCKRAYQELVHQLREYGHGKYGENGGTRPSFPPGVGRTNWWPDGHPEDGRQEMRFTFTLPSAYWGPVERSIANWARVWGDPSNKQRVSVGEDRFGIPGVMLRSFDESPIVISLGRHYEPEHGWEHYYYRSEPVRVNYFYRGELDKQGRPYAPTPARFLYDVTGRVREGLRLADELQLGLGQLIAPRSRQDTSK